MPLANRVDASSNVVVTLVTSREYCLKSHEHASLFPLSSADVRCCHSNATPMLLPCNSSNPARSTARSNGNLVQLQLQGSVVFRGDVMQFQGSDTVKQFVQADEARIDPGSAHGRVPSVIARDRSRSL